MSKQDVRRYIEDQPITSPEFYKEDYVDIATDNFMKMLNSKGFSFGDDLIDFHVSEDEFWECFKDAEV
jgi:hypothetical protein